MQIKGEYKENFIFDFRNASPGRKFIMNFFRKIIYCLLLLQLCGLTALAQDPPISTNIRYAIQLARKGKLEPALQIINRDLEKSKSAEVAWFFRGLIHVEQKKYDDAITDFNKAISVNPAFTYPYGNKARVYLEKKEYKNSLAAYNEALLHDSSNAVLFYNDIAYIHYLLGNNDQSIANCDSSIKLNAHYAYPHSNKGNALFRKGEYTLALKEFQEAVTFLPSLKESNIGIIKSYLALKDTLNACQFYCTAIQNHISIVRDSVKLECSSICDQVDSNSTVSEQINYFKNLAFIETSISSEYKALIKWMSDIRIQLNGEYTNSDLNEVKRFIAELSPLIAPLKIQLDSIHPNLQIYFVPKRKFSNYISSFRRDIFDNKIAVTLPSYDASYKINSAVITVVPFLSERQSTRALQHEILHAIGFMNHSKDRKSTLFPICKPKFARRTLTVNDAFAIRTLYDEKIFPGFGVKDFEIILKQEATK